MEFSDYIHYSFKVIVYFYRLHLCFTPCDCVYLLWNIILYDKANSHYLRKTCIKKSQYKTRNQVRSKHVTDFTHQPDTVCKAELICIIIYYSHCIWSHFDLPEYQSQQGSGWWESRECAEKVLMVWHSSADHSCECLSRPVLHASWLRHMLLTKHVSNVALVPSLLFIQTSYSLLAHVHTHHTHCPANTAATWQRAGLGSTTARDSLGQPGII